MRLTLGAAIAGGLLCVACSSGGDADPVDSTAGTATTVESVATTDPAGTEPPDTAPTTKPPAPPTTEQSTESLIAEIEADLNAGEQAVFAAGADPDDLALRSDLENYLSGPALLTVSEFLDSLARDGLRMRPSADVANTLTVQRIETASGSPPDRVIVELCRVDAAVVFEPTASGEVIVNDAVETTHSMSRVNLADGVWRLDGGTRVDEGVGDPCVEDS